MENHSQPLEGANSIPENLANQTVIQLNWLVPHLASEFLPFMQETCLRLLQQQQVN